MLPFFARVYGTMINWTFFKYNVIKCYLEKDQKSQRKKSSYNNFVLNVS